jgi:hypothetical protein
LIKDYDSSKPYKYRDLRIFDGIQDMLIHNEVEDEDLQVRYLIHNISGLAKIILKKLWLEGLPIKKLWIVLGMS